MGFKTGTLISPADLREFVLPGHKLMAADVARRRPARTCCTPAASSPTIMDGPDRRREDRRASTPSRTPSSRSRTPSERYGDRIAHAGRASTWTSSAAPTNAAIRAARPRDARRMHAAAAATAWARGNSVANYVPAGQLPGHGGRRPPLCRLSRRRSAKHDRLDLYAARAHPGGAQSPNERPPDLGAIFPHLVGGARQGRRGPTLLAGCGGLLARLCPAGPGYPGQGHTGGEGGLRQQRRGAGGDAPRRRDTHHLLHPDR